MHFEVFRIMAYSSSIVPRIEILSTEQEIVIFCKIFPHYCSPRDCIMNLEVLSREHEMVIFVKVNVECFHSMAYSCPHVPRIEIL